MKNYEIKGNVIEITLDNDKVVKVGKVYIERCIEKLDIDMEDALLTWLEDEGYMENLDQEELCDLAKENKSHKVVNAKVEKEPTKKTQKERVKKENPTKEMIIQEIAKILPNFATDVNIENTGKIITFTVGNDNFKIDLTQKRKPKAEK
jgi:hypothetical protein